MGQESRDISISVGRSVLTVVVDREAAEVLIIEKTGDGEHRHLLEGLFDAATVAEGSHWAVGGVLSQLESTVEVRQDERDLEVHDAGQAWLAVVPLGANDELVLTFTLEGRVLRRSRVNVRDYLPRPPTYYAPID